MIDLKKLTKLELIDLSRNINAELEAYENRDKILIYSIFREHIRTEWFLKKENAIERLKEFIDNDFIFYDDLGMKLEVKYVTEADAIEYCLDYGK